MNTDALRQLVRDSARRVRARAGVFVRPTADQLAEVRRLLRQIDDALPPPPSSTPSLVPAVLLTKQ